MTAAESIPDLAPLEAVLFDIDGTLCDSDPLHYAALCEMFAEIGMKVPDEEFLSKNIAGKHNDDIAAILFPDDIPKGIKFMEDGEEKFRRLASENLPPIKGLYRLTKWIEDRGLKRAAVTNAPKQNAELMISKLGLQDFFDVVIVGSDCEHAKPSPDPYLKALEVLKVSKDHTFVCEDSLPGIRAGVAAGMPVVGLTTNYSEPLLMEANPTILIKDYEDPKLWEHLEELDKRREDVLKKHPPQFPGNLRCLNCKNEEQETVILEFENHIQTL
ncbi:broad-range sugar phosphate phosphatase [Hibiscus trionum]|uniref:Broad-range sugar phosphate phosphatase n=1 Tax=Hibiscus trionum TaxID=183268 RepID=A0A9W7II17_HIBTR|nr:broad-range sugar phosphate phosphatase [Hibiscus trionum]